MNRQQCAQAWNRTFCFAALVIVVLVSTSVVNSQTTEIVPTPNCERTIKADVVAFESAVLLQPSRRRQSSRNDLRAAQ
jgi:hypothetical protein